MLLAQMKRVNPQANWDKFTKDGGWIYFVIATAVLVTLVAILVKIREWLRPSGLTENSSEDMLLQFRDIHRQGELSADEYQRIREQLTKKSGESGRAGDASSGLSADDSAGTSSKIPQ